MECSICFCDSKLFKVLQCGHYFCAECVKDLHKAPTLVQNGNHECSKNGHSLEQMETKTQGIPCPQCRHVTEIGYVMKNKFCGKMMCKQCDEEKSVDEFRWCHECCQPVCSKCFMDKHISQDLETGAMKMHKGSKWDNGYPQAAYCIARMQQDSESTEKTIQKSEKYLQVYLEGFREYMNHEIEQSIKQSRLPMKANIEALARSFSLSSSSDFQEITNNKCYESILSDLIRLADLKMDTSLNIDTIKLKSPAYPELAKCFANFSKNLEIKPKENQEKFYIDFSQIFGCTKVLMSPEIKNPSDLAYLESLNVITVTDFENGLFFVDPQNLEIQRIQMKKNYGHYSKITQKSYDQHAMLFLNVQSGSDWGFVTLEVAKKNGEFLVKNESGFNKFPSKENAALSCAKSGALFCCTSKSLYLAKNENFSWQEIYGDQKFTRSSPILVENGGENLKILLFNEMWKSVDILEIDNRANHRVINMLRLSLPAYINEKSLIITVVDNETKIWLSAKNGSKIFEADFGREKNVEFVEKFDFGIKSAQKIVQIGKKVWFLAQNLEHTNCRQIEILDI